jgi:hypothetical protein
MNAVDIRPQLLGALRLDLIGPDNGTVLEYGVLPQVQSRWYPRRFLLLGRRERALSSRQDFEVVCVVTWLWGYAGLSGQ